MRRPGRREKISLPPRIATGRLPPPLSIRGGSPSARDRCLPSPPLSLSFRPCPRSSCHGAHGASEGLLANRPPPRRLTPPDLRPRSAFPPWHEEPAARRRTPAPGYPPRLHGWRLGRPFPGLASMQWTQPHPAAAAAGFRLREGADCQVTRHNPGFHPVPTAFAPARGGGFQVPPRGHAGRRTRGPPLMPRGRRLSP